MLNTPSTTPAAMAGAAPPHTETELKLAVDSSALDALADAPAVVERARNRGTVRRLENIYFDTADRRLHRRGLALRVRRIGRRYVQTLKSDAAAGPGGALRRGEWEAPVGSPEPDLAALPHEDARRHLEAIAGSGLDPVFTTRIRRRKRLLDMVDEAGQPSLIEIAFDEGTLEAGNARLPLAEVELELKSGSLGALYRLALELHGVAPLRVETESKSDRGYRLAGGEAPPWHKARDVPLSAEDTTETAFIAILRSCVDHWLRNQAAALDGRDPEGVHQVRVALRQIRSAVPLFKHVIPPDQLSWLKGETAWIAGGLGPARDWDVFLAETLPPVEAAWPGNEALSVLRRAAAEARDAGYRVVRDTAASPRCAAFLLKLGWWVENRAWRDGTPEQAERLAEPIGLLAERVLRQRHRAVLKAGRGFATLTEDERHAVRIALKKLRYAVGFFQTLFSGRRVRAYGKAVKRLQTDLGRMNDRAVAKRLLATLPLAGDGAQGVGLVLGWQGREAALVEPGIVSDWEGFTESKPFWRAAKG